jgi:hypothetical protein
MIYLLGLTKIKYREWGVDDGNMVFLFGKPIRRWERSTQEETAKNKRVDRDLMFTKAQ